MDDHRDDPKSPPPEGLSRRGFIATLGTGAVAAAATAAAVSAAAASPSTTDAAPETISVTLTINGERHRLLVEPRWSLLYVLRDRLGLTARRSGASAASAARARCSSTASRATPA